MKKILVVCDLETNGFKATDSVLSICMIKLEVDTEALTMRRTAFYDKYYHLEAGHIENYGAIKVNGLTHNVIEKRRAESKEDYGDYPLHFSEDEKDMNAFFSDCDMFVTHNTGFDLKFFRTQPNNVWCSMKNASIECKEFAGAIAGKKSKDPKLSELAEYLGVKIEEGNLHGSMYDTITLEKCLCKLLKRQDESFMEALNNRRD